jgi:hypothetical protein
MGCKIKHKDTKPTNEPATKQKHRNKKDETKDKYFFKIL